MELLGGAALQSIQQTANVPKEQPLLRDRLIWLPSKRGAYTSKQGYEELKTQHSAVPTYEESKIEALRLIWGWTGLLPRVRMFLWRAIHEGLPTSAMLHSRITAISPKCTRCHIEDEYLMHLLFYCHVSRATWHASSIALRVDHLPLSFATTLLMMAQLWKERNEKLFTSNKVSPLGILKRARILEPLEIPPQRRLNQRAVTSISVLIGTRVILVDASWDPSHKTGTGVVQFNEIGKMQEALGETMITHGPLQAEAAALLQALIHVKSMRHMHQQGVYQVFTDCSTLVEAIRCQSIENLSSWKAGASWHILYQSKEGNIAAAHIARYQSKKINNATYNIRYQSKQGWQDIGAA